LINGDLDKAVYDLKSIINAEKLRKINSVNNIEEVLNNA
jgi:guanylate kinase